MPRPGKGPRLYLRTDRINTATGRPLPDFYFIRDGATQRSTGCGPDRLPEAERALAIYISEKWRPQTDHAQDQLNSQKPVGIAEVLSLYATERVPELASDPVSNAGYIRHLNSWWGDKYVRDVRRSTCKAYVQWRTSQAVLGAAKVSHLVSDQTARRELEVLSAAIGYWHAETPLPSRPKVWLPAKSETSREALTRTEAAALLLAARGYRRDPLDGWRKLEGSQRANRAHLCRFILVGLYTGTRSAAICALLWAESPKQAWVDLEAGMIYRRGRQEREQRTKRRPVVKIPRRLLAHLRRWKRLDEAASARRGKPVNAIIHHGGDPIATRVTKSFKAIARDASLHGPTPHWLRHTCATWLMENGADMWDAAAFTGMTTAVLEKHYGHHRPDHQSSALAATGRRLRRI